MAGNPLELLRRVLFTGIQTTRAQSASNQFAGRTTLNSGDTTVTVSSSVVTSDSIILHGMEANTSQSSGFAAPIDVMSIVDGSHFTFGQADGVAVVRETNIMWQILHTN